MQDGLFRRRRLPHWDVDDATYFVTTCLAGSIPARGLVRLQKCREQLERQPRPVGLSADQWGTRKSKLFFAEFDEIVDTEPAVRYLADPSLATEVENSVRYFADERYDLFAYVVMPSHYRWLFHPTAEWSVECVSIPQSSNTNCRTPRQLIVQSVNRFSSRQCNCLLNRAGKFWQDESYDHVVRDDEELLRIITYIENNPVKAGLVTRPEDWQWSSPHLRSKLQIAYGEPLPTSRGADLQSAISKKDFAD
jgi:REP-associated tyrosine transposase